MLHFRSFATFTILPAILAAVIFAGAINVSAEPAAKSPPGGNTTAGVWDDSVKPVDPGNNPKGGSWDDSVKPADPSKPPKAVKGNEAGATAIEYGKPVEPDAKKPDEK